MNDTPTSGPIASSITHHDFDAASSRRSLSSSHTNGFLTFPPIIFLLLAGNLSHLRGAPPPRLAQGCPRSLALRALEDSRSSRGPQALPSRPCASRYVRARKTSSRSAVGGVPRAAASDDSSAGVPSPQTRPALRSTKRSQMRAASEIW